MKIIKKILAACIIVIIPLNSFSQDSLYFQNSGIHSELRSVHFVNDRIGWTVGIDGVILITNNSGLNWTLQDTTSMLELTSVFFLDSLTGWSVGTQWISNWGISKIIKTQDGGLSWHAKTMDCFLPNDVFFIDSNNGWAVCRYSILKTTDGGNTWETIENDRYEFLSSIFFIDKNHGWINGEDFVLRTEDGGATWEFVFVHEHWCLNLHSLHFADQDTGWVVGFHFLGGKNYQSAIFKTIDGGKTWIDQNSESIYHLNSVYFIDDNNGWAVGEFGTILKTQDGGENWILLDYLTHENLNSVFFPNDSLGWIVGSNGTILHTSTGGHSFVEEKYFSGGAGKFDYDMIRSYPNPFNNKTNIMFHLSNPSRIKIEMFDLLGRNIEKLVDGERRAGEYIVGWTPLNLSGGIYFCRIQIKDRIYINKILYQK